MSCYFIEFNHKLPDLWQAIRDKASEALTQDEYDRWLASSELKSIKGIKLVVETSDPGIATSRVGAEIMLAVQRLKLPVRKIVFRQRNGNGIEKARHDERSEP
jgi:hypothetical protein